MKSKIRRPYAPFILPVILFFFMATGPAGASGPVVDHGLFGILLKKYVKSGKVDYNGFQTEESLLDRYLEILEKTDTGRLSPKEQFAFFINAYNAWTIKLILSKYPDVSSIKDLGTFIQSPWKKKICRIDGDVVSLDHIEHDILRPRFGDPRVHFAINCAARSCPPLRSEPYTGDRLDRQLDDSTRAFINDPKSNYMTDGTLHVSRIFKWFSEDFKEGVLAFFHKYAKGDLKGQLEEKKDGIRIDYLDYNWSLNGQ
jgi:hypothetical protein